MITFKTRESSDPWRGRQPRYEKLVHRGGDRFYAVTRLPSGRRVAVRLGRPSGR